MSQGEVTKEIRRNLTNLDNHVREIAGIASSIDAIRDQLSAQAGVTREWTDLLADGTRQISNVAETTKSIVAPLDSVVTKADDLSVQISTGLSEFRSAVDRLLSDVGSIDLHLNESSARLEQSAERGAARLEDASGQMSATVQQRVQDLTMQVESSVGHARDAIAKFEGLLYRAQASFEDAVKMIAPRVVEVASPAIDAMKDAFVDLQTASARILENVEAVLPTVERKASEGLMPAIGQLMGASRELGEIFTDTVGPGVDRFDDQMRAAQRVVADASSAAASIIERGADEAVNRLAIVGQQQMNQIEQLRAEVDRLTSVISDTEQFRRFSEELKSNVDLMDSVQQVLSLRKQSVRVRIETALTGLALGAVIGVVLADLSWSKSALIVLPTALVTFWAEPVMTNLVKVSRGSAGDGDSPNHRAN